MMAVHEAAVSAQFNALEGRFKAVVAAEDVRLKALLKILQPVAGQRLLDLGCGKGRFAAHLQARGADVIGLDRSAAMLARAEGLERVLGSARRLPFASRVFDGVILVEVIEHMNVFICEAVLAEVRRVLRPGGTVAIIDKNAGALDARRPWLPSLVVKWIDERRGLGMYPPAGLVRERWFWPEAFRARLGRWFETVQVEYLLRPDEAAHAVFRRWPSRRLWTLWSARVPGG
jgi:SAM-dependent methyltransferase